MAASRKLPPRAELRRLYVQQNLSLAQIAQRYGTAVVTVRHTLARDARRDGVTWPLKARGAGHWRNRKSAAIHTGRDECRNILVAAEIREAMESFELSQTAFAALAEISQAQVSRILSTSATGYCRRTTAQKVERTVRDLEKRASRRRAA
jgi:hypothetical protein